MNPRIRRLTADSQLLRTEFAGHPHVEIQPIGWEPSEQYRVIYRLPGVMLDLATNQPVRSNIHSIIIQLPTSYPREKPFCRTESSIFHPNFGPRVGDEVCVGDFWTPSQTLVDIIASIGEMIQFQRYNVRSPLNAVAARWVAQNESAFPLGTVALYQAEPTVTLGSPDRVGFSGEHASVLRRGHERTEPGSA